MTAIPRRALAASIPHRVDVDGGLCGAGAGIRPDGSWGVYWLVGTRREWIDVPLAGAVDAIRLSRELNSRDRLA